MWGSVAHKNDKLWLGFALYLLFLQCGNNLGDEHMPPPSTQTPQGMQAIRQWWAWLTRIGRSRGFGVQSPSDYRFVRYVVGEHWPYYAYKDLQARWPAGNRRELRLCRLYLRLANYVQPRVCVDLAATSALAARYIGAGCQRTRIVPVAAAEGTSGLATALDGVEHAWMLRATCFDGCLDFLDLAMSHARRDTLFILEGINSSSEARATWRWLAADPRTGVTFDLYHCGIAFFDTSRSKCNYKINL